MHHKQGILNLINAVNGEIRNPIRLLQFNKRGKYNIPLIKTLPLTYNIPFIKTLPLTYNIPFIKTLPLTYNNGWLSGFRDSDGSIYFYFILFYFILFYFNELDAQMYMYITQKNKYLLDLICNLYGGLHSKTKG
jgi:hypothetical protein